MDEPDRLFQMAEAENYDFLTGFNKSISLIAGGLWINFEDIPDEFVRGIRENLNQFRGLSKI